MQQTSNAAQIAAFLRSKGEGPVQIAAIEGNWIIESGLDPTASNPAEGAIGVAQWEKGRRSNLDQYAAAHHGAEQDLATQENFAWAELTGPYRAVLDQINQATDPGVAAAEVDAGYEVSSGSTRQQRIDAARSIYGQLAAGQPLTIGSSKNGGSGAAGLTGGVQTVGDILPGGAADPFNWPTEILGGAASAGAGAVLKAVLPFATKAMFVALGAGLVVLGFYRAAEPARQKLKQTTQQVGQAVAAAAA
jgi:hypothetical protein